MVKSCGNTLGDGVMVAHCTLDAGIGVQIPVPQPHSLENIHTGQHRHLELDQLSQQVVCFYTIKIVT